MTTTTTTGDAENGATSVCSVNDGDSDKCTLQCDPSIAGVNFISDGYAPVKSAFVIAFKKPEIDVNYVSQDQLERLERTGGTVQNESDDSMPAAKRLKLKGKNNRRPAPSYLERKCFNAKDASVVLCPSVRDGQVCSYGAKCGFQHDVLTYLSAKPPDLGSKCPVFDATGACHQGVTCRWAGAHTDSNGVTIVDVNRAEAYHASKPLRNILHKDAQRQLQRRAYSFAAAEETLNCLGIRVKEHSFQRKKKKAPIETEVVPESTVTLVGSVTDSSGEEIRLRSREKKHLDWREKLYLAPLTTVGNLPFRRICVEYGADITCGEMAMAKQLLQGRNAEWALLKRHSSERIFGAQICGGFPDTLGRCAQLLNDQFGGADGLDFVDLNCGCPIDLVYKRGEGSALLAAPSKLERCVRAMDAMLSCPVTVKIRTGVHRQHNTAHDLIPRLRDAGAASVTLHGRSREARYRWLADWTYIRRCAQVAAPMPLFGNGDVLSWEDLEQVLKCSDESECAPVGIMIGRGALIKPWIFTELKERRHWDISSSERMEVLRKYMNYGLEHWGSDSRGVENTRRFLLEWLSFLHRYIPVGLLEHLPQRINERPPLYCGRDDLETLMASPSAADWVRISEMLLGPVPSGFTFLPKHQASAYK